MGANTLQATSAFPVSVVLGTEHAVRLTTSTQATINRIHGPLKLLAGVLGLAGIEKLPVLGHAHEFGREAEDQP